MRLLRRARLQARLGVGVALAAVTDHRPANAFRADRQALTGARRFVLGNIVCRGAAGDKQDSEITHCNLPFMVGLGA